ncbi:MFS transporter [Streptomyces sp. NPDC004959]|uniref:MFS transporter n=2 Tax=Streptomyces TaxID=1883 RepID=UPI00068C65EA|nr:MFS transporter [Streptomyces sp. NRRL F-5630]
MSLSPPSRPGTPAKPAASSGDGFGLRFTFPLMLGTSLNPVNSSLLATGLAGIAADFHLGPGPAASLVSVLYLCSAVMQPTMGKLATIFGPRKIFLSGVTILLAGGVLGAVAPGFRVLLLSRALIGIGSSACYPASMALVRRRAEQLRTGVPSTVLGNFSIASQIVAVLGLPLGGVLAGAFGWRALFLVNVPLAALALVFAAKNVEKDPPAEARGLKGSLASVDPLGIALFALSVVCLLQFLNDLDHPAWPLGALAFVTLAALIWWERRTVSPLIDVRSLARNPALRRTYTRQLLVGLGVYASMYSLTQWLEGSAGYSSFQVGLIMLPMSAVSMILARLVSTRGWVRRPLLTGNLALVGGGLLMLTAHKGSPLVLVLLTTGVLGFPNGLCNFANQTTLFVQTSADEVGVAAGLFRTFGYIGAIFSSSVIALSFGDHVTDAGFHHMGWIVLALGALTVLTTLFDRTIPTTVSQDKGPGTAGNSGTANEGTSR